MGRRTDLQTRNARPKERPYKIYDGDGLSLRVPLSDEKSWWLRYKHNGQERVRSLGKLMRVSLKEAQEDVQRLLKLAAWGVVLIEHRND